MDYSNIFTSMQAEVTLIAVIVLLFLYDLIAGERGRRRFSAVACGLLALLRAKCSGACSSTCRCTPSSRAC